MASLSQTIPAVPVRDAEAAMGFFRDRLGFDVLLATLDQDGNLVTFFQWVSS